MQIRPTASSGVSRGLFSKECRSGAVLRPPAPRSRGDVNWQAPPTELSHIWGTPDTGGLRSGLVDPK